MDVPWEKPAPGHFTKQTAVTNRPGRFRLPAMLVALSTASGCGGFQQAEDVQFLADGTLFGGTTPFGAGPSAGSDRFAGTGQGSGQSAHARRRA